MVVTFMSRDLGNHVLCRVCHLVNKIVVFWSLVCFLFRSCYRINFVERTKRVAILVV